MWYWYTPIAAYGIGMVLSVPSYLRRRMNTPVCSVCGARWGHLDSHPRNGRRGKRTPWEVVPLGSVRERNTSDVRYVLLRVPFWPAFTTARLVTTGIFTLGRGISSLVLHSAALTAGELERMVSEREQEIDRLTRQIEQDAHVTAIEADIDQRQPGQQVWTDKQREEIIRMASKWERQPSAAIDRLNDEINRLDDEKRAMARRIWPEDDWPSPLSDERR